ncbi:MAG: hypothetical protein JST59_05625 [Actinobacteria bacterium]|nr:hypothetical protein [Actinomycetota bacterium]
MQYVWSMAWLPHAIGSGQNPLLTSAMWAPGPFDLATTGWVPLAALAGIPATLTIGPLAAYNLIVLLAPALAAFFTFRLCHYLTDRVTPSLVGGFLFGFSSYLVGQMNGHLHLMLVFLIPLGVHIVLLHLDGRTSRRRFVLSFAAVVVAQALISTEVLFTALLFAAIALLAGWIFADADSRDRLRGVVIDILIGGVVAAVVLSPYLYYALIYDTTPPLIDSTRFSMDALNPLVPTPLDRLGRTSFAPVAAQFPGAFVETGGYLGIAIVLLAGWWLISTWRRRATRIMLAVLACSVIASLGTRLTIAGEPTISLPWKVLEGLPLFEQIIPTRLSVYTALIIAIAVAMALAARAGSKFLRWGLALVGVVMLLPSGGSAFFHSTPPDPSFFTSGQYKKYIDKGETVLAFPYSQLGYSMVWQARAKMHFNVAGGYLAQQPPEEYLDEPVVTQFYTLTTTDETPCMIRSFIERRDVGAVLIEAGSGEPWGPELEKLGMHPQSLGGIDLYRVPSTLPAPTGCT